MPALLTKRESRATSRSRGMKFAISAPRVKHPWTIRISSGPQQRRWREENVNGASSSVVQETVKPWWPTKFPAFAAPSVGMSRRRNGRVCTTTPTCWPWDSVQWTRLQHFSSCAFGWRRRLKAVVTGSASSKSNHEKMVGKTMNPTIEKSLTLPGRILLRLLREIILWTSR